MSSNNKFDNDFDFASAFENSLVKLTNGEIVKGMIIGFNHNEVFVDLGYKSDGLIPKSEFEAGDLPKIGEEIEVLIIKVNDGEGNVLLSKKRVDLMKHWDFLQKAYQNKESIEAKVVNVVKGGVLASANGVKIFVPASQVSDRFIKDLNDVVGNTLTVRLTELNPKGRKIVGSARILLEENKQSNYKKVWEDIEVGKKFIGIVKHLTNFGVFVDIGGVDGLVHISELTWNRIKHPSEVVAIGDSLEVTVLEFDKNKNKISFGYKKNEDNPWNKAITKYKVGESVSGTVVRILPFGAFIEIQEGFEGLCHISQISDKRLVKVEDVLQLGMVVNVKILEIDLTNKKVNLSIKDIMPINPIQSTEPDQNINEEIQEDFKEES